MATQDHKLITKTHARKIISIFNAQNKTKLRLPRINKFISIHYDNLDIIFSKFDEFYYELIYQIKGA